MTKDEFFQIAIIVVAGSLLIWAIFSLGAFILRNPWIIAIALIIVVVVGYLYLKKES